MSRNAFAECEREYNAREEAIEISRQEREQVMDIKREVTLSAEAEDTGFEYDVNKRELYIWDRTENNKLMASVHLSTNELEALSKFISLAIEEVEK